MRFGLKHTLREMVVVLIANITLRKGVMFALKNLSSGHLAFIIINAKKMYCVMVLCSKFIFYQNGNNSLLVFFDRLERELVEFLFAQLKC